MQQKQGNNHIKAPDLLGKITSLLSNIPKVQAMNCWDTGRMSHASAHYHPFCISLNPRFSSWIFRTNIRYKAMLHWISSHISHCVLLVVDSNHEKNIKSHGWIDFGGATEDVSRQPREVLHTEISYIYRYSYSFPTFNNFPFFFTNHEFSSVCPELVPQVPQKTGWFY